MTIFIPEYRLLLVLFIDEGFIMKIAYINRGIDVHSNKILDYWDIQIKQNHFFNNNPLKLYLISFHNGPIWPNLGFTLHSSRIKEIETQNINYNNRSNRNSTNSYIKIVHKPRPRPRVYHFFLPRYVKNAIRKIQPDLIHATYLTTNGYYAAKAGYHPLLQQSMASDILYQSRKWPYSIWVKKALDAADMLVVDAEKLRDVVRGSGYEDLDIRVIPIGLVLKEFISKKGDNGFRIKHGLGEDIKVVICNRWHEKIYGWKYLLRAFKDVVEEVPEVRLLALGSGSETDGLKKMARDLGIGNKVIWQGEVLNEDMPHYLNAADVYVSSSLSDGSSVSLQEAMACGLPVVVTDNAAIMEWVEDGENGLVVPRKDPKALAEALIELLKDDNMRKRFGKKNRKIAEKRSSFERYMEGIKGCYKELLERYNKI